MPQDSSTEPDTRRLLPDGSTSRSRPVPPPSTGASPDEPSAAPGPDGAAAASPATGPPAVEPPAAGHSTASSEVVEPSVAHPPTAQPPTAQPPTAEPDVAGPGDGHDTRPVFDETAALGVVDDRAQPGPEDTVTYRTDVPAPADRATALAPGADGDDPGSPQGPGTPRTGGGRPPWRRPALLVPAAVVLGLAALYGVDLLASGDDVPRGTVVAGVDLGGLSPAAAAERLTADLAPQVAADRTLVADDVETVLHPPAAGVTLDVPATVDAADDQPLNPWTRIRTLFGDREIRPVLTADETAMTAQLEQVAGTVDRAPVDATITLDGTTPSLLPPVDGRSLDRAGAAAAIRSALTGNADPATAIDLPVDVTGVRVEADEARRVLEEIVTPALSAPVRVVGGGGSDSVELPVGAIAASLTFTPGDDGTLAVAVDPVALQSALGDELGEFGSPAQDARFEVTGDTIAVVPSVDGQGIDPDKLAEQLLPVLDQPAPRTVTAMLGPVPADFTTEEARALGITEEVSSFTTNFTSTASGTNIRVVADEVDGAVVRPGETFSLNEYTGPRGTAQGYVPAAVISGGEISKAVGGGISQFATTMFNAVFFAGLEDVYHKPHSFYISRYPAGREATVYEGVIDLQWRNDTDTGIYVQTEWVPGALTVRFWGTRHYEIESVSGERRNIRRPAVQEKVDDGDCTAQSGSTGFDITVTRVFKDVSTGAELRREAFNTSYAAEAVIRCVAPEVAKPSDASSEAGPPAGPSGSTPSGSPPSPAG